MQPALRTKLSVVVGLGICSVLCFRGPVAGGADGPAPGPPRLEAVRFGQPPVIDGVLDDECWKTATSISGFIRVVTGGPEFEPSEAWIGYDQGRIYVAFYCHDSRPQEIQALQRKRGGDISKDDSVLVSLDVKHDHRTIYSFQVTPRGTQREDIPGESAEKYEWRGDWQAAGQIVSDGWTAELAIPLDILRYPRGQTTFGVHFARHLARMADWSWWPNLGRTQETPDLTQQADWSSLSLPSPRSPLITMPYLVSDMGGDEEEPITGGVDAKYVTPRGLVAMLSHKPDFRNIEDVVESIDFTYTERRFPEYRPFFREGAGQTTEWGEATGSYYPPIMIFYSRRIPSVDLGAKLFGKLGRNSLGFLTATEREATTDSVLAYGYDVGARGTLQVGAVNHHEMAGFDNQALHLGTKWAWPKPDGTLYLNANSYHGRTEGEGGDGQAWYADFGLWKPDGLGWWGWYEAVGESFQTVTEETEWGVWPRPVGIGFVPETGIRGGGLWLTGSRVYGAGDLEQSGWDLELSSYDDPAGDRWHIGSGYHTNWRNDTSWRGSLLAGERRGLSRREFMLGREWHNKDFYTRGRLTGTLGEQLGGPYRFLEMSQGFRPSRDFSWQVRLEHVRLEPDLAEEQLQGLQALLTATYDISDERSVSTRLVYRRGNLNFWLPQVYYDPERLPDELMGVGLEEQVGKVNIYAAYRQRVAHGRDIMVIIGDPNTAVWEPRIAVKLVWTHFLGG